MKVKPSPWNIILNIVIILSIIAVVLGYCFDTHTLIEEEQQTIGEENDQGTKD